MMSLLSVPVRKSVGERGKKKRNNNNNKKGYFLTFTLQNFDSPSLMLSETSSAKTLQIFSLHRMYSPSVWQSLGNFQKNIV